MSQITQWMKSKRASMQSGAFTIDLGAPYNHIRVWSDPGSSTYRLNWGAAADSTCAKRDDSMLETYDLTLAQQTVYIYGDGAVGAVNVEAWY